MQRGTLYWRFVNQHKGARDLLIIASISEVSFSVMLAINFKSQPSLYIFKMTFSMALSSIPSPKLHISFTPSSNSTLNGIWYSVSMIASFCVTVNSADNKVPIRRCNSYCPYYIQENLWNQPKMSM